MFDNPGRKVKDLATVVFWIGTIASIIVAIAGISNGVTMAALLLFAGPLVSFVSTIALAAFGELVENSTKLVAMQQKAAEPTANQVAESISDELPDL